MMLEFTLAAIFFVLFLLCVAFIVYRHDENLRLRNKLEDSKYMWINRWTHKPLSGIEGENFDDAVERIMGAIDVLAKEQEMSEVNTVEEEVYPVFEEGKMFQVVDVETMAFVDEGYTTFAAAKKDAEKLAATNPGKEYVVIGPYSVYRADVPVVFEMQISEGASIR